MVYEPSVGYAKARQILRERFGNEYAIAQAWITKIEICPNIKPNDALFGKQFPDQLQQAVLPMMTTLWPYGNGRPPSDTRDSSLPHNIQLNPH